jgi:hypothetical protein
MVLIPPATMESTKAAALVPCHSGDPSAALSAEAKSNGVFQPLASSSMVRFAVF